MKQPKKKPNPKDLLKKAFAHKGNDVVVLSQDEKANAVFGADEIKVEVDSTTAEPVCITPLVNSEIEATNDVPPDQEDLSLHALEDDLATDIDVLNEFHFQDEDLIAKHLDQDIEHLQAPELSFVDTLLEKAAIHDVFRDTPIIELNSDGFGDSNEVPPDLLEHSFELIEDETESAAKINHDSLSLLDQVKADKDSRQKEYKESLKKLEAIDVERSELEKIMHQQLLKQQEEEAAKLNEGIEKIRTRNRKFLSLLEELYNREDDTIQADNIIGIAENFQAEHTITLQSYLTINRYLQRFNIKYDMDEIRVFLSEDLLNIDPPPLDFDYYYLWMSDLDKKITPYMWDKHKLMAFSRADFKCELCGGFGVNNLVELYPQWRLFDSNRTQILQGFLALCPKCVDAKNYIQLKRRNLKMRYESAREHIKNVNGWDDRQVENALLEAEESYAKRIDAKAEPERFKKWKLNISVLEELFGIPMEEPKFNQRSHIQNDYHPIFEPHVSYIFGKIESDRMMKTGKTKFLSIKLDVELIKQAR